MRAALTIILSSALSATLLASIPRDPPSTRIEILYSTPTPTPIPIPSPPDFETQRAVLNGLDQIVDTLEYQLRTSVVPVLDYGAQHPEKTKPLLYCRDDQCTFSITFQGVKREVPNLEEYDDAVQNYQLLEKQARRLGMIASECLPSDSDCTLLHLPLLTVIDQDAIITFKGPHICTQPPTLAFLSYPFARQELHVVFPTCTDIEKETSAGYEVVGLRVSGLRNAPRPEGISLSYTLTPRNNP